MQGVRVADIAAATGGVLIGAPGAGELEVKSVTVDSRSATPDSLFVALVGERTDGHLFLRHALGAGAVACLVERGKEQLWIEAWEALGRPPAAGVVVVQPLHALGELARWYKRKVAPVVVAVTGSNGKTTTKEMIASILSQVAPTHRSGGNYNTEIGLPLTLCELSTQHRFLVVEMAMRGSGQIRRLAAIAEPEVGVVTNVGPVHLEILGTVEAIARAKQELIEALPEGGTAVLNGDDPRVAAMAPAARGAQVLFFGLKAGSDVYAEAVDWRDGRETEYRLVFRGKPLLPIRVPLPGRAALWNSLAAAAAALALGIPAPAIQAGLARMEPPARRLQIIELPPGITLIEDVYNASPASMRVALETLAVLASGRRRRVAVLGDMKELGTLSEEAHRELGREVARQQVDLLITVGEWSRLTGEEARRASAGLSWEHHGSSEAAAARIGELLRPGDVVLVKGSRAMTLETVTDHLRSTSASQEGGRGGGSGGSGGDGRHELSRGESGGPGEPEKPGEPQEPGE